MAANPLALLSDLQESVPRGLSQDLAIVVLHYDHFLGFRHLIDHYDAKVVQHSFEDEVFRTSHRAS